jgi:serine/threonine protein kinase
MANLDAVTVSQQAIRLGLVTPEQVQDMIQELGKPEGDPEPFLRALERKGLLTPWQSQKLVKGDTDGYFLGGYRILYKIASGSFGRVYRAEEPSTGKIVAIKVLRARWTEDKRSVEMFEREGKVGMTMKHPSIVEILAVRCDPKSNQFYIVMEFVEGWNLRDFLKSRQKLEPAEALKLIEETAEGLAYAYSRGVTHRDMKLTNVLVSSDGLKAKLVDFGLATLNEAIHKTVGIQQERTVDYAGLEKATNVPQGDTRSDIYFLGCVLYELLTGHPPLEKSKNPHERMRSYRFTNVKSMTPEEVNAPPSVFQLVENMMSLDPKLRFQTPSQLLDAIRTVRRETTGEKDEKKKPAEKNVFIVESDLRLQDALRERFKEIGYRVFMSNDPVKALDRYRQNPYSSLILDVGTVGEEGLFVFEKVMEEAQRHNRLCAGIAILSEHQKDWLKRFKKLPTTEVLVRPVTLKQLQKTLEKLTTS